VLSHLQRGGSPSAHDRRMGRHFGIAAVDLVVKQDFGKMVCLRDGHITTTPLKDILGKVRRVDVKTMYDAERYGGRRSVLS
jgi:6-phosphofructokinase